MADKIVYKYKIVTHALLITFWVLALFPFVLQESVSSIYDATNSYFFIAGEAVILFLTIWTISKKIDFIVIGSFLAIALVSTWLNDESIFLCINGIRTYLPMLCLLPITRYLLATRARVEYFIPRMDRSLYIFLWVQVPCMVYQCILYGAYDQVGGSMGWMMSGVISCLIYTISFYLMLRRWNPDKSYMANLRDNWILLVLLFPSYLNETKISFIYLAMYFFLLIPMDRKFLLRLGYLSPLFILALAGAGYLYLSMANADNDNPFSAEYIQNYTFGDDHVQSLVLDGYMNTIMPDVEELDFARGLKFAAIPIVLTDNPYGWYLGFGPGQYKGGTHVDKTEFAEEYDWLLRGTAMMGMIVILELGGFGIAWIFFYFFVLFRFFKRVRKREARLQVFMFIMMITVMLYASNFILTAFTLIFVYISMVSSRWGLMKLVPAPEIWLHPHRKNDLKAANG